MSKFYGRPANLDESDPSMNPSSTSASNGKSTKSPLLICAIAACSGAALVLGLILIRQTQVEVVQPAAQPAEVGTTAPLLSAEIQSAKGFDLLLKRHDPEGAKAVFEACLREHPEYADAWHGLAVAQRDAGDDLAVSLRNHDRAIELAPERADYYWWQGETYKRLNNHDASIKTLERGLNAGNTRHIRAGQLQVSLAQSYRAKNDLRKALELNDEAITLGPGNKWYYRERGYTYRALGDRERAEADFSRGSEIETKPR